MYQRRSCWQWWCLNSQVEGSMRTRSLGKFMVSITQNHCMRQQSIELAGLPSAKVLPLRRTLRSCSTQIYLSWVSMQDEFIHELWAASRQVLTALGRALNSDFVMITWGCCIHSLCLQVAYTTLMERKKNQNTCSNQKSPPKQNKQKTGTNNKS